MALEKDIELLDDYLANRMNAEERASFEKQMDADPELKREFNVQQKLVEGIKQARLAELKAILNNTPVPTVPGGQALLAKLGVWVVVAGLVGTGIYFFTAKNEAEKKPEPERLTKEVPSTSKEPDQVVEKIEPKEEAHGPVVPDKTVSSSQKKVKSGSKASSKSSKDQKTEEVVQPKKPEAFDPTEKTESTESYNETVMKGYARVSNGSSIGIESITDNKKYDFHYQFKDGKLMLYGQTFREKAMYEILEFFVDKQRKTIILFHENNYYLLKEENKEITQLKRITDPALLKRLNEVRGN